MKDVRMTVTDGAVCVFDGYKTVRFEKDNAECKMQNAELKSEVGENNPSVAGGDTSLYTREAGHEVTIRMSDGVEPIAAARLYVEYLELLRSCPRYRTGDAVASQVKGNSVASAKSVDNRFAHSETARSKESKERVYRATRDDYATVENELKGKGLEMKPKKITIRILEGEVV